MSLRYQGTKSSRTGERRRKQKISLGDVQQRVDSVKASKEPLVFSQLLEEAEVEQILEQLGAAGRRRVYTPQVTLAAFLGQAISEDGSCQQAVHRVNSHRCAQGLPPASVDTASYCEARQRLPEELFLQLIQHSAKLVDQREPKLTTQCASRPAPRTRFAARSGLPLRRPRASRAKLARQRPTARRRLPGPGVESHSPWRPF